MNVNYNPIFILPEFNLTKKISGFFKLLIIFQIASIIIIIIIFYPMEVIFLFNLLFNNYSLSNREKIAIDEFKQSIDNISNATLSCNNQNKLIINNNILAKDINNLDIICTSQIKNLYSI
jgi:hypothetical protein